MNQVKKAKIAANLKPVLKKYGVKGTLAVRHHSTIVLNIKSGPIDFVENHLKACKHQYADHPERARYVREKKYLDVNPYWYHEHFDGVAKQFLKDVMEQMYSADWYDKSDIQTDYFNTAYYVDVNIGKWSKPYEVVK
jgi:hypothetical protein